MITWYSIDTWIVIIGVLCSVAAALLGNFLVLRRMSMMGDAISHAVLPGLAVAFLLSGTRGGWLMFLGAAMVGVMTAVFTEWVNRLGRVDQGASMGVVFTTLFAIGLLLIVQAADYVDLDPGCVLYGSIEMAPLEVFTSFEWGGWFIEIPETVVWLCVVLVLNIAFITVFYKELKITSFDPALAKTLGFRPEVMHYSLMTLVAITTVAAFEAVGSILVIAMLIVPAATAYLLTNRLISMILLSVFFAIISSFLGHLSAITVPKLWGFEDTTTAGMMALVGGLLFFLCCLWTSLRKRMQQKHRPS